MSTSSLASTTPAVEPTVPPGTLAAEEVMNHMMDMQQESSYLDREAQEYGTEWEDQRPAYADEIDRNVAADDGLSLIHI